MFGGARGRGPHQGRGRDVEAELELSLEEAHHGGRRTLQMQGAEPIDVNIPAGARDGSTIRLAGQGGAGANGSEPGDLYLHIRLRPHPVFKVKGDDLELELSIAPWEAVLGAGVEVPTIDGKVELKVPAGARAGQRLRLRGQGLNRRNGGRGDEFVRLRVVVPKEVSAEERRLYEELKRVSRFNPRS
jgi:DnaJ-class molecular chaperone